MNRRASAAAIDHMELLRSAGAMLEDVANKVKENYLSHDDNVTTNWKNSIRQLATDVDTVHHEAEVTKEVLRNLGNQAEGDMLASVIKEDIAKKTRDGADTSSDTINKISMIFDGKKKKKMSDDDDVEEIETQLKETDFICPITAKRMVEPQKK
jgi:hypothetical protein